jgi:hypothetical protein
MPESGCFACAVDKVGQTIGWNAMLFAKGFLIDLQFG